MSPATGSCQHEDAAVSSSIRPLDSKMSDHHCDNGDVEMEQNEADLSVDKVSRMMREQDADLLESMHYAASQVSQYSPGGTPVLRPKDRSLPMEDVPLMMMPMSSTSQLLMSGDSEEKDHNKVDSSNSEIRTASFAQQPIEMERTPSLLARSSSRGSKQSSLDSLSKQLAWHGEASEPELVDTDENRYRRLLSGEIRAIEIEGAEEQGPAEEGGETTCSPVSVAQEAETLIKNEQETGDLAERRRKSEAMQFANAIGENVGFKDDLCIIEDQTDDEEEIDWDDDEACESKEIRVDDATSIAESIHSHHGQKEHRLVEEISSLPSHVDITKTPDLVRRKSRRPLWPFGPAGADNMSFLDNLSDGTDENNFVYKGICANPPEITKRGMQRGNYAQLHRKAWLEVSDKYHRYGKNLRLYYRYWERLGFPTNQFFDWLDSKGDAAGQPLPNLEECPRSILDSDTVLYITNPEVTEGYALDIVGHNEEGRGRVIDVDGDPVHTGTEGWIFVLRDNVMYGAEKITSISGHSKQRFHHSSFFGGKAVVSAGIIITDEDGFLTRLYPHSGHYRPGEAHTQRMLYYVHRKGVDLRTFQVDTQQFRHVTRDKDAKGKDKNSQEGNDGKSKDVKPKENDGEKKLKKVDSLHLEKAVYVACFLAHKAGFIGEGIFDKIHRIRKADVTSVTEALNAMDDGGFWAKKALFLEED